MADSPRRLSIRKILRNAFANRDAADETLDAITELQAKFNAFLIKADSDSGTADTDHEATLSVTELGS